MTIMFPSSAFTYFETIVDTILIELLHPSSNPSFVQHLKLLFGNLNLVVYHNYLLIPSTSRLRPLQYHNNLISLFVNVLTPFLNKLDSQQQMQLQPFLLQLHSYNISWSLSRNLFHNKAFHFLVLDRLYFQNKAFHSTSRTVLGSLC